ncbi:hypothetical protein FGU71_06810 [Erythrobacter insulae]|uniref:Uncharacterized protein n=1 Tax=Erythrobacter insulae TaxID=2584124 RepID=A0A547PBT8_9SPHN|nr:hypothetical protein [Erythrobacter insulae]TRD11601.1 hypothetical protein FGU71_06810 [Erythrobacter insulae]
MKKFLLATAGTAALIAGPAFAQDDGHSGVEVDLRYANNIDTSVTTDVTYTKNVALRGTVRIDGDIDIDSSAVAVTDAKQLLTGNLVNYREENEINAENGFVDPVFGPGWSEAGDDPNDNLIDGMMQPQIRAGYFAPIINTVDTFDLDSSGNLGVNLGAGYFNMQMNAATLAVSSDSNEDAEGGWAEASTTSLQSLLGVRQAATPGFTAPGDDPEQGGDNNNFRDRNSVLGGSVNGSGNIGVNAAAGTFNQQSNLMTLAVATDAVLAEANAGLVQSAFLSSVEQQDSINYVAGPTVAGASGNIGINFASGVGNQQLNSLTIASSQGASGGNGNGGGGGDPD